MEAQRLAFAELLAAMTPQVRRQFRRKGKWTSRQEKKHLKELNRYEKEKRA